jgi:hypothetical protein
VCAQPLTLERQVVREAGARWSPPSRSERRGLLANPCADPRHPERSACPEHREGKALHAHPRNRGWLVAPANTGDPSLRSG